MDYAYTLQGWFKGVNGQFLDPGRDMSMDSKAGESFAIQDGHLNIYGQTDLYMHIPPAPTGWII